MLPTIHRRTQVDASYRYEHPAVLVFVPSDSYTIFLTLPLILAVALHYFKLFYDAYYFEVFL